MGSADTFPSLLNARSASTLVFRTGTCQSMSDSYGRVFVVDGN